MLATVAIVTMLMGSNPAPVQPATAAPTTSASGVPASEYKETRLQIRFGGKPYITTLPSDSSLYFLMFSLHPRRFSSLSHFHPHSSLALRDVAEFLAAQTLSVDVETVNFATQYPRCVFSTCSFGTPRLNLTDRNS